jgi:curved DNA-binding protein CbpA
MYSNSKTNKNERRNYYRTLNVQPDAPLEIIKNNYRTLLQKLRLHPDLGGKNWNATIINEAYNTLRHPDKRASYDKSLLKQYGIRTLSRGHLVKSAAKSINSPSFKKDTFGNQRNFYRLFNIQPDSPSSIVKTSYLTLSKNSKFSKALLNEAFRVLGNTEKRALYDKLLSKYDHPEALDKLIYGKNNKALKVSIPSTGTNKKASSIKVARKRTNSAYYQPVITQYCAFCKTPHAQSPCKDTAPLCNECLSPLFPPSQTFQEHTRRNIVRISKNSKIRFYDYWPGNIMTGTLADMSPTGIQLLTTITLNKGQVIKLDGEGFKAVGIVSYQNTAEEDDVESLHVTGIRFLTVNFPNQKGQFLYATA